MNAPETDRFRPSIEEISLFLAREFSQTKCRIVEVGNQTAWIDHEIGETAVCTLLKVGRTLATGEVRLYSEGHKEPVAHAVGTHSIPPAKRS